MADFDPFPKFLEDLSSDEKKEIKKKRLQLYNEASQFHSDFSQVCFYHLFKNNLTFKIYIL